MTDKQRMFLELYLGEAKLNATEAARGAGYLDPDKDGWRTRQKPEIKAAIQAGLAALSAGAGFGGSVPPRLRSFAGVYVLRADNGLVKIGCSRDVRMRYQRLCSSLPYDLEIISFIQADGCKALESQMHQEFHHVRVRGEWFRLSESDIEGLRSRGTSK